MYFPRPSGILLKKGVVLPRCVDFSDFTSSSTFVLNENGFILHRAEDKFSSRLFSCESFPGYHLSPVAAHAVGGNFRYVSVMLIAKSKLAAP
jgi:hypothetical protein